MGLSRPWEGTGRQEWSVPALGGCRPPGGVCAGPGRVQAARRGLCRPWGGGAGRQEVSVPAPGGYRPPGVRWPQSTISVLRTHFSVLRTHFSVLRTHFSVLRTICSLLLTPFSVLRTLSSLLRTLHTAKGHSQPYVMNLLALLGAPAIATCLDTEGRVTVAGCSSGTSRKHKQPRFW